MSEKKPSKKPSFLKCHAAGVSHAVNGSKSDYVILYKVTRNSDFVEKLPKTMILQKVTKNNDFVKSYQDSCFIESYQKQ